MPRYSRIEIAGGIASGKTTLAKLLGETALRSIFEDFRSNPFWKAFYSDPEKYSFETEITFLLQHYHSVKTQRSLRNPVVCDFSFLLDRAYADVNLRDHERQAFQSVYDQVTCDLGEPLLLIALRCPPYVELERIRKRRRREESSLDIDYLGRLNGTAEALIANVAPNAKLLRIDSGSTNFASDRIVREEIKVQVLRAVRFGAK